MLQLDSTASEQAKQDALERFAGRSLLAFTTNAAGRLMKFGFHLVVSRSVGLVGYGAYTLGYNLLVFIQNFTLVELDQALIRFVPAYRALGSHGSMRGILRTAWTFCTAISLVIGTALFFSSDLIGSRLFHSSLVAQALRGFAPALPFFTWVALGSATAQAFRAVGQSVLIQDLVFPAAMLALVLPLTAMHLGLQAPLLAFSGGAAIAGLVGLVFASRRLAGPPPARQAYRIKEWSTFGAQMMVIGGAALVFTSISPVALAIFGDVRQVGIYNAALMLVLQTSVLFSGMAVVLPAMLAELFSRGALPAAEALLQAAARWLALLAIPVFLCLITMAPCVLALFGPGFEAGTPLVVALALGNLVTTVTVFNGYALVNAGRQQIDMLDHLGLAAAAVVSYPIAAHAFGPMGVAVVTGALNVGINLVKTLQVRCLLHIRPWDAGQGRILAAGAAAGAGWLVAARAGLTATGGGHVLVLSACILIYTALVVPGLADGDRALAQLLLGRRPAGTAV